jgi:hypothetical protein
MIWAFLHAVRCIFLAEKAKKDVASIVNANKFAKKPFKTVQNTIN